MKIFLVFIVATLALAQAEIDWSKVKRRHVYPWFLEPIYRSSNFDSKIVGGQEAAEGQYPFQVALFIERADGTYFCGGTLIKEDVVLTAAHCIDGALSSYVVLGAHNIRQSEPSQVQISVQSSYIHEAYDSQQVINDIAVLKLSEPATLNDRIQLAQLPSYSSVSNTFAGSAAETVGWGKIADSIPGISSVLRYVESSIITNLLCNISYLGLIQSSHICLRGSDGKGSCDGDSGGPLLVEGVQVGITSFGITLGCEVGWPTVYTRVTSYLDWLVTHTGVEIDA